MPSNLKSALLKRYSFLFPPAIGLLCMAFLYTASAEEIEITFTNLLDNTAQRAIVYVPEACKGTNAPLLIITHYMSGDRFTAKKLGYYPECEKRGWLLACPELHGHRTPGQTSLAALEAQHDVVDHVRHMQNNYKVDATRIYLAGRSMGGMLGLVTAAKYPQLFAAVVAGQPLTDLAEWMKSASAALRQTTEKECGECTNANLFEYQRRSAISYAPNFKYVPVILWHGSNDPLVAPEHSEKLTGAIRSFYRFQPGVNWYHGGGHNGLNFPPAWICDQLQYYVNTCDGKMTAKTRFYPELNLVFDEPLEIFWLAVTPAQSNAFARVEARLQDGALILKASRASRVSVNLDKVIKELTISKYSVSTDTPLELTLRANNTETFKAACEKEASGEIKSSAPAKAGTP